MVIQDRIYGRITIKDPVIAELILSRPMQRLKEISQDGASHFIQPVRNVTRFEHSIGAWYLSNKFTRPIEEQIASLLHDVPHTAFSHVIDIVMADLNSAYHDKFTKKIILASEIPDILAKHHVDIGKVLNKEDYHLLENDLPDISVDRWDYFMRDSHMFGVMPKQTIQLFLRSVKEKNERFYFEDTHVASLFAIMYMNCGRLIWLDPSSHGSYFILASALKYALQQGILTNEDFFRTDSYVLNTLQGAGDSTIDGWLNRLQPGKEFSYAPKAEAEFYGANKARVIDPWVEREGELRHLSEYVSGMKAYFEEYKARYAFIGVKPVLSTPS